MFIKYQALIKCIRPFHRPLEWVKQIVKGIKGPGKEKGELSDWSCERLTGMIGHTANIPGLLAISLPLKLGLQKTHLDQNRFDKCVTPALFWNKSLLASAEFIAVQNLSTNSKIYMT